jgi:hypothetical protein
MLTPTATGLAWVRRVLRVYSVLLAFLCLVWWAGAHWMPLANGDLAISIGPGRVVHLVTWTTFIRLPAGRSGGVGQWVAIWYQDRPNGPLTIVWGATTPLWPLVLPALAVGGAAIGLEVWGRRPKRR